MAPILSVIMSTYNRENMVLDSVNAILNQTFKDFEFIVIDDNSQDNTYEKIKSIDDNRIKLIKNKGNCGCTINYHVAQNIAQGQYIAHIDDDDISLPERFEKQIEYMQNHPEIVLSGTFIETFGENKRPSWVFYTEPDELDFCCNFYNPICHSSIIYRKNFMVENNINYDISKKCAQDFDFYKQILLKGGKLSNLNDILVKYRMHNNRLTDIKSSQDIQIYNADLIKKELLSRYFNSKEIEEFMNLTNDFPFNKYDKENVLNALYKLEAKITEKDSNKTIETQTVITDVVNNRFRF